MRQVYLSLGIAPTNELPFTVLSVFLVHLEICDEQVIVQANDTEHLLDEALVDLGVPKQKVIPGFVPTEFFAYGIAETAIP